MSIFERLTRIRVQPGWTAARSEGTDDAGTAPQLGQFAHVDFCGVFSGGPRVVPLGRVFSAVTTTTGEGLGAPR